MIIYQRLEEQLNKLSAVLHQLDDEMFTTPIPQLNHSTIGQHSRHILEIIICLENALVDGQLDYENRKRNLRLENEIPSAILETDRIRQTIKKFDRKLRLQVDSHSSIETTYRRELIYCIEHTIHHLALINVALKILGISINDESFGVGYSTIKYKQEQCAQ